MNFITFIQHPSYAIAARRCHTVLYRRGIFALITWLTLAVFCMSQASSANAEPSRSTRFHITDTHAVGSNTQHDAPFAANPPPQETERSSASDATSSDDTRTDTSPTSPQIDLTPKGLLVRSHDGTYTIGLGGFIQIWHDTIISDAPDAQTSGFALGMLRPTLHGQLSPYVQYNFTAELASSTPHIVTAYVRFNVHKNVHLVAGLQKPIFNIERWQGDVPILFLQRADVSTLTPSRDLGVTLFTRPTKRLHLDFGVYGGAQDNQVGLMHDTGASSFHLRMLFLALGGTDATEAAPAYLLLGGVSRLRFYRGDPDNPHLTAKKTLSGHRYVDYQDGVYRDGTGIGATVFAYGGYRELFYQFELAVVQDQISDGLLHDDLFQRAWQLSAGYAFGGWNGWYGVRPYRDVFDGGLGALEVRARIQRLQASTKRGDLLRIAEQNHRTAGSTTISGGLSWILSHPVRLQIDYHLSIFNADHRTLSTAHEHVVRTGISVGL